MVTMTQHVSDEIFKDEENENKDLFTSSIRYTKRKVDNTSQRLHEKMDPLFDENKYSGDATYVLRDETSDEGDQAEIESREDSYNKTHLPNEERIKLLARKYIKKLSNEENARLEMLRERVRQLFPRATADDFAQLEKIGAELKDLEEENKRVEEKYNLD
jgi:uncharacterized protein YPO0396